jgi:NAD(P)-dependent dehydrogenase (short-subunit alcohol dehydrogenase family)
MDNEIDRFPKFGLEGKTAVVTGAGQGLGKWIALGLAHVGAAVAVCDCNLETAQATAEAIRQKKGVSFPFKLDVGDPNAVEKVMNGVYRELEGLDILINNAGVNIHKPALDITPADFDFIVRVNSRGVYFCSQAAARIMITQKRGKIVNIASAAAFLVRAGVPNSVYAMTKAGIVMLTKALSEEWAGYNINVNAVAPGYFATPLVADRLKDPDVYSRIVSSTPLGRVGHAEDIVGAVIFLASEASDFVTGQTLCVDGGRTVL